MTKFGMFLSCVVGIVCGLSVAYAVLVLLQFEPPKIQQTKASGKWICVKQETVKTERK